MLGGRMALVCRRELSRLRRQLGPRLVSYLLIIAVIRHCDKGPLQEERFLGLTVAVLE